MIEYLHKLLRAMSAIKLGEIDIGDQVLDNEYKIKLLFKILQKILDKNPDIKVVTEKEFDVIKKEAEKELQDKYPKTGVKTT